MPPPTNPESDLPTTDELAVDGRELAELERRLAAFDSATKRLSNTVETAGSETGSSSRPSSGNRPSAARKPSSGDDISALRPAISASDNTPTGALTARRRASSEQATPGFTSVFGRPSIPTAQPAATATAATTGLQAPTGPTRRPARWRLPAAVLAGALLVAAGALAIRPESSSAAVAGTLTRLAASIPGTVRLKIAAGGTARGGEPLALIRNDHPDRSGIEALQARHQALLARQASLRASLDLASRQPPGDSETEATAQERLQRLRAIERETADLAERLQSLTAEIALESARLASLTERQVASSGNSYVRRLLVSDGQRVAADAEIAEVLDLDTLALEVPVAGDAVRQGSVALIAAGGGCLKATVATLQADGASVVARVVPEQPLLLAPLNGQRLRVAFLAPDAGLLQRLGERLWRPLGW